MPCFLPPDCFNSIILRINQWTQSVSLLSEQFNTDWDDASHMIWMVVRGCIQGRESRGGATFISLFRPLPCNQKPSQDKTRLTVKSFEYSKPIGWFLFKRSEITTLYNWSRTGVLSRHTCVLENSATKPAPLATRHLHWPRVFVEASGAW
jgi:hypothetical protein